jgi:hypothetical protein
MSTRWCVACSSAAGSSTFGAGASTVSMNGASPSVGRTSPVPSTGPLGSCTLATSVATTAPSSALCTLTRSKISTVLSGHPSSSAVSAVSAGPALCNQLARQPSGSCCADLFRFFIRFSFGDFLGGSGAASSSVTMSTSSSAVPLTIYDVSASQIWGAIGIRSPRFHVGI